MQINKIILEGNISKINDNDERFVWFDIAKNERYKGKDGNLIESTSFFSVKMEKNKVDENIFKIGSWVVVNGIPKSYIDKNNNKHFFIFGLDLKSVNLNNKQDVIYDTDGVEIWDGKRCEKIQPTDLEQKEMRDIINELA